MSESRNLVARVSASARRFTRRTRSSLPAGLSGFVRRCALEWGKLTARFRMEPHFIVAGAQRCGTTTLFHLLESHPNVVRPTLSKGTGYFDDNFSNGRRWYRAHFPLRLTARLTTPRGQPSYTFEISGYSLLHPLSASRVARELPGVKVVVMVRDPVERAYSAHRHESARGFETLDFESAIRAEEERVAGERDRLEADPTYVSYDYRHHCYRGRGRYAEQVQRYIDELGEERVYVLEADRFFADPVVEFAALQEWLGLPAWTPPVVEKWNERPRQPMAPELEAELRQYFEPYDEQLAVILDRTPVWREHASYEASR